MNTWFQIEAKDTGPVEILIFDQIGKDWWSNDGVSAKSFAEEFGKIDKARDITVRINSPGGNVWDGLAIYNLLNTRKERVTTVNDGVAASIASVIFLAGKVHRSPKNALLMIHNASGLAIGNAADMDKMAEDLRKHDDILVNIYHEATGKPEEDIRAKMDGETWFNGSEARDYGFVTDLTDEVQLAAHAFDLSRFRNAPAAMKSPQQPQPPAAQAGQAPQKEDPMRSNIIALLKKHGVTPDESATDEQLSAQLDGCINREREKRISGDLRAICATRPSLDFKECLPKALADESMLDILKKFPTEGDPNFKPVAQDLGNPAVELVNKMAPGAARAAFVSENWNDLRKNPKGLAPQGIKAYAPELLSPRASNTLDSSLMTTALADGVITVVGNKLAALKAFARDFSIDPVKPKAVVKVRKVTTGGAVQSNPSNFETGDTTISDVDITMAQVNRSFHVTNDEMNQGSRLVHLANWNGQSFANGISDVVTALMLTATYGTAITVGAAASFTAADLAPVLAAAKNYEQKNLLLDGGHLAYLLPTDKQSFRIGEQGAYGFDLIAEQNRWTSATSNTCGFICSPNAIVIGAGMPLDLPSNEFISLGSFTIPGIELPVLAATWFSRAGRIYWASYDVMFGAVAGDATAGELLITS